MKKIAVIGKTSYIGSSFKYYLQSGNMRQHYQIDMVSSRNDEWKVIDYAQYDTVLLAAGIAHRKITLEDSHLYDEINHRLAVKIALRAKQSGAAHFIFLSSMSVYGLVQGEISKQTPLIPTTAYGVAKARAEEQIFEQTGVTFKVAVIRPPMVYGYCCPGNYTKLSNLAKKTHVFPNIDNQRSMIYIENLVEFLRLIVEFQAAGIYCPQNASFVSTSALVKEIAHANNTPVVLSKALGSIVQPMISKNSLLVKLFGNLTYCQSLSTYPLLGKYNKVNFANSVKKCETKL